MTEKNLEVRRAALETYVRFSREIYALDAADFAAAAEIIAERREIHPEDAERMLSLEGDVAVWAAENAAIRSALMTEFAEQALHCAADCAIEELPEEIGKIAAMNDDDLRRNIASRVEKIKYKKRMRGNTHE